MGLPSWNEGKMRASKQLAANQNRCILHKNVDLSNRFEKGIIFVLSGHFISSILQLFGFAIAARFISKEEFGTFILLTVVANFLVMAADFGMTGAVVRFLSIEKDNLEEIAGISLGFSLQVSFLIIVTAYFWGNTVLSMFNLALIKDHITYVVVLFFFQYHFLRFTAFLQGLHLYKRSAFSQVVYAAVRCSLIWLLVVFFSMQLNGLILAVISSMMISCIFAYLSIPWYVLPKFSFNLLKKILQFGFPLQVNNFLAFIYERIDIIILGSMLGPISVSTYEIGYKLPNQLRAFFEAFRSVFFPQMSQYYGNKQQYEALVLLNNMLRIVSFVMSGITLIIVLYASEIISFLFSWRYGSSAPVFTILMLGITIGLCNHLMGTALVACGRPKAVLLSSIPETLLNVGINLLLIPSWGIIGAAWASVISRTAVNPIYLVLLGKGSSHDLAWTYLKSVLCLGVAWFALMLFELSGSWKKVFVIGIFVVLSFYMKSILLSDLKYSYNILFAKKVEN
jgi:O-antigen/teichoic acid export membrane protein